MKRTITIDCPDGLIPVYNNRTGNIEIVKEDAFPIKTYEDAEWSRLSTWVTGRVSICS